MNVLVLLSTYNGEKYLVDQLESLFAQKGVSVTVLVRDDGSSDNTVKILKSYQKEHNIRIVQGSNVGFARSFSELVKEAACIAENYEFFAFCDQDDYWLPEKLIKAVEKLHALGAVSLDKPVMYCSNVTTTSHDLTPIANRWKPGIVMPTKESALVQNFATGCTMLFNRKALLLYSAYSSPKVMYHDYEMYRICSFLGYVVWDDESYIYYRQHGNNQIGLKTFSSRMRKRMQGHYKQNLLEKQNRLFLQTYYSLLGDEERILLKNFVDYRKSFPKRIMLLFNRRIRFLGFEMDFFYRVKVLMGWV